MKRQRKFLDTPIIAGAFRLLSPVSISPPIIPRIQRSLNILDYKLY